MIERISCHDNPNFFLLAYDRGGLVVKDLAIVPKHFFTAAQIERRKPLADTARRAGWEGCNILLDGIPLSGRIALIEAGRIVAKADVLLAWQRTVFLRNRNDLLSRGWLLTIMRLIERLQKSEFDLHDLYAFKQDLEATFPGNRHILPKVRQQLQVLRDQGYLEFLGGGTYRLRNANAKGASD